MSLLVSLASPLSTKSKLQKSLYFVRNWSVNWKSWKRSVHVKLETADASFKNISSSTFTICIWKPLKVCSCGSITTTPAQYPDHCNLTSLLQSYLFPVVNSHLKSTETQACIHNSDQHPLHYNYQYIFERASEHIILPTQDSLWLGDFQHLIGGWRHHTNKYRDNYAEPKNKFLCRNTTGIPAQTISLQKSTVLPSSVIPVTSQ